MRKLTTRRAAPKASAATSPSLVLLGHARQSLLLLLALTAAARRAAAASASASPKPTASKQHRVEIRVQDFSFSDGPTERPVIEIETTDMKGSEISDALLAMAFDESLRDQVLEPQEEESFSNQDALLLALCVLCSAQLLLFGVMLCWRLLKRFVELGQAKRLDDPYVYHRDEEGFTADMFASLGQAIRQQTSSHSPAIGGMTRRALALLAFAAAVAVASAAEVEIRVQDFSFADGLSERPTIAIEAQDIKGSELQKAAAKQQQHQQQGAAPAERQKTQKAAASVASQPGSYQESRRAQVRHFGSSSPAPPNRNTPPRADAVTAALSTSAFSAAAAIVELSAQEQVVVLVVVLCALCFAALVLVSVANLARFGWHFAQEQRTLRRLFREDDVAKLSAAINRFPATSSLLIRRLAVARLQHLEFVRAATDLNGELSTLSFDEDALELRGLPRRVDTAVAVTEMTLVEVQDALAQLRSEGEAVALELLQVSRCVPPRWTRYVAPHAWLVRHDASLQTLQAHSSRVQQLVACVSELLMRKLHEGEAVSKGTFVRLLAALRPSSATATDDAHARVAGGVNGTAGSSSSSRRASASASAGSKDEFSFFVKAFDELSEQKQVKSELRDTMRRYHNTVATNTAASTSTSTSTSTTTKEASADLSPEPHDDERATDQHALDDRALLTRKLEQGVDRAEALGVTHFEEVERAQLALEHARRERFCAAIFSQDAKELENVEALALTFVSLGARRQDAVLKAGEILANRSNTLLLVTSLRGMFDELRKHDVAKMHERRRRDAAKLLDKRARMADKFRLKQQLVAEKLAGQRAAQQQQDADARRERARLEAAARRQLAASQRRRLVWLITKLDVLVVLLVAALVFFDSVRQLAFLKPVCVPADTRVSGVLALVGGATTHSLAVLGCQVAYGAKMAALLLLASFALFVLAQLNLLVVVLPAAAALALYHVRAEWMNMLVRTPLLGVVYAFNSGCLYLLNRAEEDAPPPPLQQQQQQEQQADDAFDRSSDRRSAALRLVLAYAVFPLLSLALSVAVGVGIACDDPQQCAVTAFRTAAPVLSGLATLAREAYGL
ncbi:hypothetical protein PybrP1_003900 [[Pythium] brassicae (nom. inval.)]|nr:hypothetical protein PybrP1_003900 [[Pythium] brassicae (nom. inval.)]